MELSIYKEKVIKLQQELDEIKAQKLTEEKKFENVRSRDSVEESEGHGKSNSVERHDSSKIEEYKDTISKLRHELKETKKKLNEIQTNQNKEVEKNKITISELTTGISKFRKEVEHRDQKIENLENQIMELKNSNQSPLNVQQTKEQPKAENGKQMFEAKQNIEYENEDTEFLEDQYKKTIQDLTTQNEILRNELEDLRRIITSNEEAKQNSSSNRPSGQK